MSPAGLSLGANLYESRCGFRPCECSAKEKFYLELQWSDFQVKNVRSPIN